MMFIANFKKVVERFVFLGGNFYCQAELCDCSEFVVNPGSADGDCLTCRHPNSASRFRAKELSQRRA